MASQDCFVLKKFDEGFKFMSQWLEIHLSQNLPLDSKFYKGLTWLLLFQTKTIQRLFPQYQELV